MFSMIFFFFSEINPDSPPSAFVVYAGLEPLQFTNLFPFWTVDERVREINLKVLNFHVLSFNLFVRFCACVLCNCIFWFYFTFDDMFIWTDLTK